MFQYDVLTVLNEIYQEAKEDLKTAIRALKCSNNILPRLQRVRIMRALTLHLFNTIAGYVIMPILGFKLRVHSFYHPYDVLLPFSGNKATPDMKEGLAKSFVLAFNTYLLPPTDKRKPWVGKYILCVY